MLPSPADPVVLEKTMTPKITLLFCGILVLVLLVSPAAASQVLTGVSFSPDSPLLPGDQQHTVAKYAIIPAGSSTFPRGHTLQMQTGLTDARWTIQVIVDGNNAALQTASGSAAFINGGLLSYPTDHDVSFTVTIDGTVPGAAAGTVTLLDMVELDNAGSPVPGSQSIVSRPGAAPAAATTVVPSRTPSPFTAAAAATRSPGFPADLGIAALLLAVPAGMRRRQ
jgi:hypothetical protein